MRLFSTVVPCAALLAASSLVAQAPRSSLTGTVTDAQGRSLQGARITVQPGEATALTDAQGVYTFPSLPAGTYTVSVAYQSFAPFSQQVTIQYGAPVRVDASLQVASSSEKVEVYSGRVGGEVEAINRTFNSPNIINVLPADVITSLPNANVADAIGRLPGVVLERDEGEGKYIKVRGTEPRLTHTTLDGVTIASPETVRQIKLDLIPADLVSSVQINKTLQANLEGDGIGGSVDLQTKSAAERPTVEVESLGGYNPILTGRPNYQFDGTAGRRFAGGKLGPLISASYDWNGRGINDVEPGPAVAGTYDLRDYRYFRDRKGLGGTIDYKFSDTSSVYLKGLYSHFNNFGDDWIYSPAINTFLSPTQGGSDGTISFQGLRRRPVQDIGGLQLGGNHVIGRALFHWDSEASVARTRDDGYADAHFAPISPTNPLNNVVYGLDLSNPLIPHLNVQNGVNLYTPGEYFLQRTTDQFTYSPEVDLGIGGSVSLPYTLGGHASTFDIGGRFRNEHKFENQNTRILTPLVNQGANGNVEDPSLAMTNFLRTDFADPHYYGGNYGAYGPTIDVDKVLAFGAQSVSGGTFGNSFDFREKVSAGYVMNTTNLGRYQLYAGLRIEGTNDNNLGYLGATSANGVGTTQVVTPGSYVTLLPSASVRYAITPESAVRLVYSRGLSRPDFQDLIPFESASNGGSANQAVTRGNPNIQAEYADDIDLLYERTLPRTGLLQAGFFYKNLSNPIVQTSSTQPVSGAPGLGLTGPSYTLYQTGNAGSAYVYGFEASFQQHLTYLPGLLNGLGILANYGYTNSQATFPSTQTAFSGPLNRPLIGQAHNSYNFSPTYDKRKLSVRLGMTYNGPNITSYGDGTTGPGGDTYFYSHLQIDLQGTYRLPKGFQFVAYGLNLNNEVFGFYNGSGIYPIQREFYRETFGGGLRWSPTREAR